MKRVIDKENNEITYILDTYEKGLVTQVPSRQLSSEALKAATNVYFNDAYQLITLGGWDTESGIFKDRYVLYAFEDRRIFVERVDSTTARIFFKELSDSDIEYLITTSNIQIGTVDTTKVKTDTFDYYISGKYTKSSVETALSGATIPDGKAGAFRLEIGSDGVIDVIEAPNNGIGYADEASAKAAIEAVAVQVNHVNIGYFTVVCSGVTFVPGTTALDDLCLIVTYYQGSYYAVDVTPTGGDSGDVENWGGVVWEGGTAASATYNLYVYYKDGTNFNCWKVTQFGLSDVTSNVTSGTGGLTRIDGMFSFANRMFCWIKLQLYWTQTSLPDSWTGGTGDTAAGNAPILGQRGSKIVNVMEFYDNLVVFLDKSVIRFIGRNPTGTDPWYLSVITPSVGLKWPNALTRVGTDVFFLSEQGLSYLTAIQMYGAIAVDVLSLNVTDFLTDSMLAPSSPSGELAVRLTYSTKHKSIFISRHSDAGSNIFFIIKMLRKKEGGQWSTGVIAVSDNYGASISTNWYTPIFSVQNELYVSSCVKSGTSFSSVSTGKLSAGIGSLSRATMVLNVPDEVMFRRVLLRLLRKADGTAYWRQGLWREAQWRGEGLSVTVDWQAIGDKGSQGGTTTLNENMVYRATIGLNSRHISFDIVLRNAKGDWVFGELQLVAKYLRKLVKEEI
jgi:hypothetical protein